MALTTHRTDITVPIMTPTEPVHPDIPTPTSSSSAHQPPYSPADEDYATTTILSDPTSAPDLAGLPPTADTLPIKAEAQALIDAQKFNTRKAFKAYLDEEIARLSRDAEERAHRRQEALEANRRVDDEVKKLEGRYETERRALEKRMEGMGK